MIQRRFAVKAGISYGTGAMNFGNDAVVYERELRAFPQDDSLARLKEAVEAADLEAATGAATALRDTSSRLALSNLYSSVVPVVEALAADELPSVDELAEVEYQHQRVCDFLATV